MRDSYMVHMDNGHAVHMQFILPGREFGPTNILPAETAPLTCDHILGPDVILQVSLSSNDLLPDKSLKQYYLFEK